MGLTSTWKLPKGKRVSFDPPLNLYGGLMSEHGENSFSGNVYDDAIEAVTGETLYQRRISNPQVRQMANAMEAMRSALFDQVWDGTDHNRAEAEKDTDDLIRMFKAYAKASASLLGWW